jgi:hypothetical protein
VALDLRAMDKVLEIDCPSSRAARIQAGVFGPALEDQAAWPDLAAFSAKLRILDFGRLDRDAIRRPLCLPRISTISWRACGS